VTCFKRAYESAHAARAAHSKAGFRIRPYLCRDCGRWHVTNQEKGDDVGSRLACRRKQEKLWQRQ
jgi:hypothetical protein